MSLKPICVACQRFYRPEKNGVYFLEGMPRMNGAPAGTVAPSLWQPYKLWCGDRWQCEGCGHLIIVGIGRAPISEHYKPDFQKYVAALGATYQVNDC